VYHRLDSTETDADGYFDRTIADTSAATEYYLTTRAQEEDLSQKLIPAQDNNVNFMLWRFYTYALHFRVLNNDFPPLYISSGFTSFRVLSRTYDTTVYKRVKWTTLTSCDAYYWKDSVQHNKQLHGLGTNINERTSDTTYYDNEIDCSTF
jgi:hypothetical protein